MVKYWSVPCGLSVSLQPFLHLKGGQKNFSAIPKAGVVRKPKGNIIDYGVFLNINKTIILIAHFT